jgi:hypothetical protein
MKKKLKPKEWTEKQLARLPQPGYWLYEFQYSSGVPTLADKSYSAYCVKNGYIRYIRDDIGTPSSWHTLLWSCMHTRNQIAKPQPEETFHYFATIEQMQEAFPGLHPAFFKKPENDF